MSEIPDIVYRQVISNQLTIMQMRQILQECIIINGFSPDFIPRTPLNIALS